MSNLKALRNGLELNFKSFIFPAGEVSVKISNLNSTAFYSKTGVFSPVLNQTIVARIKNSNDVLELLMLTNALRNIDDTPINLVLPYIPYSRQDRVCDIGESFSLKIFANLINSQKYQKITTFDPHSHVCEAVFDNLVSVSQIKIINKWRAFIEKAMNAIFISPDAGANKKTFDLCRYFNHNSFVRADKVRDTATGEIKETIIYHNDFEGRDVVVADDVCDGGKTFIELAKVAKSKNCGKLILYVTHGIFSKGLNILFENGIDEVWTTDSLHQGTDPRVNVFKLEEMLTF